MTSLSVDQAVSRSQGIATESERSLRIAKFVWLLILISFITFRHREAEDLMRSGGIDAQAKFQILAWMGFGLLALRLMVSGRTDFKLLLHPPLVWMVVFVLTAVASTVHSISPPLTLYRSGQSVIAILLVISLREHSNRFYDFITIYLVGNWVFFLMANTGIDFGLHWIRGPGNDYMIFGRQSMYPWRFATPLGHPSQISIVGAVGVAGLAARCYGEGWRKHLPLMAFFAVTVLLTISRTAILGMFLGTALILAIRGRIIPFILLAGIAIPMAVITPSMGGALLNYGMRGQSSAEFKSLTGRSKIYQDGVERAVNALPLGEGFVAGRAKMIVAKDVGSSIVHSHNLFIESAVGMGALGLLSTAMVLLTLFISLACVIKLPADQTGISPGWEPVAMAIPMLGFCILDRGFASPVGPFLFAFTAMLTHTTKLLLAHRAGGKHTERAISTSY